MDTEAEEVEQAVDEQWPAAAVAEREGVGTEQQHRPDDLARERRADAGRVAHQQVPLEAFGVGWLDRRGSERAEPRRDPIDDRALGHERLDEVARLLHPRA